MPAHAIVAHGAIGSRRDHGGIATMQLPIARCGWLGRCPATRKATVAIAPVRRGNSLFHWRIRESLTLISPIIRSEKPPAWVHVMVVLTVTYLRAHSSAGSFLTAFGKPVYRLGREGDMTTDGW